MLHLVKPGLWVLAIYSTILGLVYFNQHALQYFPDTRSYRESGTGHYAPASLRDTRFSTKDGTILNGFYKVPEDGQPMVLYFHGNGGAYWQNIDFYSPFVDAGYGIAAYSYRGYGGSGGKISEATAISDGLELLQWVVLNNPDVPIVVYGVSLGAGVAVGVLSDVYTDADDALKAARKAVMAVIFEAPFSSAVSVGQAAYWYLPVKWLMKDRYYSTTRVVNIEVPMFIIHGTNDTTISNDESLKLMKAAKLAGRRIERKLLQGAGHNNLYSFGAFKEIDRFIQNQLSGP